MNKETQIKVVNTCIVNALRIDEEHRMMILEKLVQSISDESKNKLLHLLRVSGSALLPDGWKVYKCTDCQEVSVKKDNRQITVGFCDSCGHPLWNDDVD